MEAAVACASSSMTQSPTPHGNGSWVGAAAQPGAVAVAQGAVAVIGGCTPHAGCEDAVLQAGVKVHGSRVCKTDFCQHGLPARVIPHAGTARPRDGHGNGTPPAAAVIRGPAAAVGRLHGGAGN